MSLSATSTTAFTTEWSGSVSTYGRNRLLLQLHSCAVSSMQQSATLGNYGANVGNLLGQQGQAYAAGALGQGNTINNAIGSGISAYQNNALVEQLRRLNPTTYGG